MNQYRKDNYRNRNHYHYPEHRNQEQDDNYNKADEENYGNMAGSLSYGLDENYGPTRSEYEHYGYLSSDERYNYRPNENYRNEGWAENRNPDYRNSPNYSPEYDALGQAYGWIDRPHRDEPDYRNENRYERYERNERHRPDQHNSPQHYNYTNSNHYEPHFEQSRDLGAHDYDNYHLSRRGERSHHGRFTNPGEFYWY